MLTNIREYVLGLLGNPDIGFMIIELFIYWSEGFMSRLLFESHSIMTLKKLCWEKKCVHLLQKVP